MSKRVMAEVPMSKISSLKYIFIILEQVINIRKYQLEINLLFSHEAVLKDFVNNCFDVRAIMAFRRQMTKCMPLLRSYEEVFFGSYLGEEHGYLR